MRRLPSLLALAAALTLATGCRDVLVDPPPGPIIPNEPAVPTVYLKGPTQMRVNSAANFRAEMVAGVSRYEWRAVGDGEVQLHYPTGDSRLPTVTAVSPGTVDLIAEAYSADDRLLATAAKTVTIR